MLPTSRLFRIAILPLCTVLLCACQRAAITEVERRVPVDVVGDCMMLRQRLSECPEEMTGLLLSHRVERLREPAQLAAARQQVLRDLSHEASLSADERRQQCRTATAETPPPRPEDVASLHRCLSLSCGLRISCLRPLLLANRAAAP